MCRCKRPTSFGCTALHIVRSDGIFTGGWTRSLASSSPFPESWQILSSVTPAAYICLGVEVASKGGWFRVGKVRGMMTVFPLDHLLHFDNISENVWKCSCFLNLFLEE